MFFGALEYKDRRSENKAELARDHTEWSAEKVQGEATQDAAAETVGSVGASVVAGAAFGAAVGSIVPVAGTAVGAVVGVVGGIAVGIAMEHKFIRDLDGDGRKESLADAAGQGTKIAWGKLREVFSG